jgi:pimeloyl-ACP methyl ester carboxylesterase
VTPPLLERVRRGERLLGAIVPAHGLPPGVVAGLDLVVVPVALPAVAVAGLPVPLALLVASAEEVAAARAAGVPVTVARTPVPGADVVLSADGPARLVSSPDAARAAFSSGARLVVYDVPAMLDGVLAGLAAGRPEPAAPPGREPLVLLSGMLGDASLWDGVAAELGDTVLPWPARIDLDDSVPEMALSVLAEAPPRFALAGHSLGGIVALEVQRRAPERVTRLALLNTSARGPSDAQQRAWAENHRRTEAGEFGRVADELAEATLGPAHRGLVARNRRMADTVGAQGLLRQLAAQATRPDSRDRLAAVDVPVLVVSGEQDAICPPALQEEIAGLCPRVTLATVPGVGHMAPLEDPAAVADLLRAWATGACATAGSAQ